MTKWREGVPVAVARHIDQWQVGRQQHHTPLQVDLGAPERVTVVRLAASCGVEWGGVI